MKRKAGGTFRAAAADEGPGATNGAADLAPDPIDIWTDECGRTVQISQVLTLGLGGTARGANMLAWRGDALLKVKPHQKCCPPPIRIEILPLPRLRQQPPQSAFFVELYWDLYKG